MDIYNIKVFRRIARVTRESGKDGRFASYGVKCDGCEPSGKRSLIVNKLNKSLYFLDFSDESLFSVFVLSKISFLVTSSVVQLLSFPQNALFFAQRLVYVLLILLLLSSVERHLDLYRYNHRNHADHSEVSPLSSFYTTLHSLEAMFSGFYLSGVY